MKIEKIDDSIGTRTLKIGNKNIIINIGRPNLFEDGSDFYCPYSIEYDQKKKFQYAGGVDSIQAIQLAMKKIKAYLIFISESEKMPISWLEDGNLTTGFDD
jgi:hypothetical protein